MTIEDTTRKAALKLLTMGLATPSEVARLIDRSRQIVLHWARDIDWKAARAARLKSELARLTRRKA